MFLSDSVVLQNSKYMVVLGCGVSNLKQWNKHVLASGLDICTIQFSLKTKHILLDSEHFYTV